MLGGRRVISSVTYFFFVCLVAQLLFTIITMTGTHFMCVFISALSAAGRHAATLWSLCWMSASALKSNIKYSVVYIFVNF